MYFKLRYEAFPKLIKHFCYWVYDMEHHAFECMTRNDFEYVWRYDMKHLWNVSSISATECTIWNIVHSNVRYEMTLNIFEGTIWNISETYETFPLLSVRYETSCIWMYDMKWLNVRYEMIERAYCCEFVCNTRGCSERWCVRESAGNRRKCAGNCRGWGGCARVLLALSGEAFVLWDMTHLYVRK